jgi:thioredoxin 2
MSAGAVHIVCPACAAVNRVPAHKLAEDGKCGACHAPLFDGHPVNLDYVTFRKHIERNDIPVVVDFWAAWCGPCKMMAPVFEAASAELQPLVRFAKVDTEQESGLASQYNIRSIPTVIAFSNGKEVGRIAGAMDRQNLLAWVRQHIT